jgi:sulfinoalanine decarboxylase
MPYMLDEMEPLTNGTNNIRTKIKEGYETQSVQEKHEPFIRQVFEILLKDAVFDGTSRDGLVTEWMEPESLMAVLGKEMPQQPQTDNHLIEVIKNIVRYSVKTGHPRFINQLFSGLDPYGLVAQFVTDSLNPSMYTYEVAPVFTLMEFQILREMRRWVGYPEAHGDGLFCPGGSMANAYGMHCARHRAVPNVKETGTFGSRRLVALASRDAHYSIKKAAVLLGIGSDNLYLVDVDSAGRMDVNHLRSEIERALSENALPFMVAATSGTTVLGAMDPLEGIADVCKQYGLWLHVDAAWGGGALMSRKHRQLLKGIERADSVTWNPHKLLAVPQQCSAFLVKDPEILLEANSACATYLFQTDKYYDPKWDTGDKSFQCGRRADVLKFWLMWQAKGASGLEQHVDSVLDNIHHFTEIIRNRPGFELVMDPEFANVCFWYIPPSLRNEERDENFAERLHKVKN